MSVLLETSKGDLVIDLFVESCPLAAKNFLKLCKIKYYNNALFHNVQQNFIVQSGDPTGTGSGGESIYGKVYGEQARFFDDEIVPHLKHKKKGTVAMAGAGENMNASQFYITTGEDLDSLDGKHTIFGEVAEGLDVLMAINDAFVDASGRPLQNIRIRHTIVLDDPFPDMPQLAELIPDASPELVRQEGDRLEDDWKPDQDSRPLEQIEEENRQKEAHNRAVVLEMIGDLPEADAKPPPNMLFMCKLNPVTTEEDLEIIFSRFGAVTSCDIIRDYKTGDSLCYGFIGFDSERACEDAYFKMNNVLIDDRRIKVDFSQSVHHLWVQYRKHGKRLDAGQQAVDPNAQSKEAMPTEYRSRGHGRGYTLLLEDEPPGPLQRGSQQRTREREQPSGQRHDRHRDGMEDDGRSRRDRHDSTTKKHMRHRSSSRERASERAHSRERRFDKHGSRRSPARERMHDREHSKDHKSKRARHDSDPRERR